MSRSLLLWLAVGWVGYAILPWYAIEDGFWNFDWLGGYPLDLDFAPALLQGLGHGRPWFLPIGLALAAPLAVFGRDRTDPWFATALLAAGGFGLIYTLAQGFAIGIGGWEFGFLETAFGELGDRQFGMGYGAVLACGAFLFFLTEGVAARGAIKGDVFVVGSIGLIVPFVLATGCVVIAAASQFHGNPDDVLKMADEGVNSKEVRAFNVLLDQRLAEGEEVEGMTDDQKAAARGGLPEGDRRMAAMLAERDNLALANTLEPLVGTPETTELFIIFRDETSGTETYGAGRYLYATLEDGRAAVDFNKAYNPPCAFTRYATCPLPPRGNRLAVAVRAGEKRYGDH